MNHREERRRSNISNLKWLILSVTLCLGGSTTGAAAVEFQPLAANAKRLVEHLEALGAPIDPKESKRLNEALVNVDAAALERVLDSWTAVVLTVGDRGQLSAEPGAAKVVLQQAGYVPILVKGRAIDRAVMIVTALTIDGPKFGPVYGGEAENSLIRQGQTQLKSDLRDRADPDRVFAAEWSIREHMPVDRDRVDYVPLLVYCHAAGKLDLTLRFAGPSPDSARDSAEVTIPAEVRSAVKVRLSVRDVDGSPTVGRFTFVDDSLHVYPPQAKRLAPDFFFQKQIYRRDGDVVLLPPGRLYVDYSRGPEYKLLRTVATIPNSAEHELEFDLERWIDPQARGFYCGDHHIHGAGCAHYTSPTEGVTPADIFLQVKGEGLNVGSVLTWGPCYEYQRQYFSAQADPLSEPFTVLKYDVEVSGFGSQALGHTCLLNLKDQTYPGSDGTKTKGWPTWTTPVLRWVKDQGGVTGYPHSASGLAIDPAQQSSRLLLALDTNGDQLLDFAEARKALLPEPFSTVDADGDGRVSLGELEVSHQRAVDSLPNYAIPEMNGGGAMEICVSAAHGACDFISAMDTERIQEWNTWYHLLNCGLPVACAGETDFPCMSSTRVGQGRTYVQLGDIDHVDYGDWCRGLAAGRSYVSDGYAHALDFTVDDHRYGDDVRLNAPGTVTVTAEVAFGSQTPPGVPHGAVPNDGRRIVGDTRVLYPDAIKQPQSATRWVEVVVNGDVVATEPVQADDRSHKLSFDVPIKESSWIAVRQFPQLHTNPIRVLVADRPIRASRRSAEWCVGVIEQLWRTRSNKISAAEIDAARQAFDEAKAFYRRIAAESRAAQLR